MLLLRKLFAPFLAWNHDAKIQLNVAGGLASAFQWKLLGTLIKVVITKIILHGDDNLSMFV